MVLLDTNVVSEIMRPRPDSGVVTWLSSQHAAGVYLSVITESELRNGVEILPQGHRRERIAAEVENMLREDFS